jgi:putative flippase GtrA
VSAIVGSMKGTRQLRRRLIAELAAFGAVGAICLLADIGLFNAFTFGLGMSPVLAKSIGLPITGVMAFFGHRHITFRHRHGGGYRREIPRFLIATTATVVLSLLPVYVARHVAGVTGVVGLNIANLAGIVLGTAARYLGYRYLVWVHHHGDVEQVVETVAAAWVPDADAPPSVPASGRGVARAGRRLADEQVRDGSLLDVQHELVRE